MLVDAGVPKVEDGCPNNPEPVGCEVVPKRLPPVLGVETPNVDPPNTLLVAGLAPKAVEPIIFKTGINNNNHTHTHIYISK